MTVLPSFQAFLQSATGGSSPQAQRSPQQAMNHQFPLYYEAQLSPTSWVDAADRFYARVASPNSSSSDDEDMMAHHTLSYKRRLPAIGSEACTSPSRVLPAIASGGEMAPANKRAKKKYLKERERCEIVRRVRAGEKQAHLAKEFGVSRAAVCYLLKHQMEILRRSSERL